MFYNSNVVKALVDKKEMDMPNAKIEEEIIRAFVVKNKQDRVIWELNNPKKTKERNGRQV